MSISTEEIKDLLANFDENTEFPDKLEPILDNIAVTGDFSLPWEILRRIIRCKTILVLNYYFKSFGFTGQITETFDGRKEEILSLLDRYDDEPPFTLQRLVEILQHCSSQFKRTHVLMNALFKVLSVPSNI